MAVEAIMLSSITMRDWAEGALLVPRQVCRFKNTRSCEISPLKTTTKTSFHP